MEENDQLLHVLMGGILSVGGGSTPQADPVPASHQSRIPIYQRAAPCVIQGDHGEVNRNRNPLHPYSYGTK